MVTVPTVSPPLDEITTVLLDLFREPGRTIYDAVYDGDPVKPTFPYGILYAVPGGLADPVPDLDADTSTVTAAWQVTAVSNYRNQAQQLARSFRDLILGRASDGWLYPIPAPAGWQVVDRRPDPMPAGVIRTGQTPAAVFTAPVKFLLTITPS